ncbi:hypothetical protein L1987_45865 [Smallanthus sonchifolius]|uniref:Uncharacterized protein n=1 Tax=Smallanthus sonchifolius TaxID=185202 RepID=A0ACB9FXY2_9ASTR|nr:hypothetical protein L1987_45865 [Smallanthus sonchifolius]
MIEEQMVEEPPLEEEKPVDEEIVVEKPAEKAKEKKKGEEMKSPEIDLSRVPYPARLLPHKHAREYGHFLDMFKQLKVNLPFIEVLHHMPKYGKFLKDLLSNKKKLEEVSKVSLSEQCFAVVQNKLPEKLGDLGRFTIPCLLGGLPLNHVLADLGASINLIPYSIYKQLDLGEPQPTRMKISLADRSVKYPRGIVENLLVKVGKFVFPVDFFIPDMDVDDRVLLILGGLFVRTAKALIDVFDRKLALCEGNESVTFDATKSMKGVGEQSHSVCMIDTSMDYHRDSGTERGVDEPAPNLEEPFEWAVELEKLLDEPDENGDEDVLDDLLEIMAELDEIIGKTTSVGKLVESVEDPEDPDESLEVVSIDTSNHRPLSCPILCSKGRIAEPTPSSSCPRSRPPRKITRELIDLGDLGRVQTPSVRMFRSDNLLGYLNSVISGPEDLGTAEDEGGTGFYGIWEYTIPSVLNLHSDGVDPDILLSKLAEMCNRDRNAIRCTQG